MTEKIIKDFRFENYSFSFLFLLFRLSLSISRIHLIFSLFNYLFYSTVFNAYIAD